MLACFMGLRESAGTIRSRDIILSRIFLEQGLKLETLLPNYFYVTTIFQMRYLS